MKFTKALEWAATDAGLFDGIAYDRTYATDHFFRDDLRSICDLCLVDGKLLGMIGFKKRMADENSATLLLPAFQFFDGLKSDEDRPRWDRLVAFHLLTMAFINEFGYEMQRSSKQQFIDASSHIRREPVRRNILEWLPRLGFSNRGPTATLGASLR